MKILVVEDEEAYRIFYRRALPASGHAVKAVASAEDAFVSLSSDTFDAILLDLVLGGISGFEALQKIQLLSEAPVIVISGQSDDETRRDATLLGASGFLTKPVDLSALEAAIGAARRRAD